MPRTPGPLFEKFLPHRGWHRWSDDKIKGKLLDNSLPSQTHSYDGIPCREWQKATRGEYGRMWNGRELVDTHVEAFKVFRGPIPVGHHVLHHCDNPPCIEGRHLWTGTPADNMADKMRKGRGGHEKLRGQKRSPSGVRGTKHALSKLTEAKVREIRRIARLPSRKLPKHLCKKSGTLNIEALAREMEISGPLVHHILTGRAWAWLE